MASEMHFVLNFTLKVPFLGFVRCARVCSAFRELPGGSRAAVLVAPFGLRLCLVKAESLILSNCHKHCISQREIGQKSDLREVPKAGLSDAWVMVNVSLPSRCLNEPLPYPRRWRGRTPRATAAPWDPGWARSPSGQGRSTMCGRQQ